MEDRGLKDSDWEKEPFIAESVVENSWTGNTSKEYEKQEREDKDGKTEENDDTE